MNIPGMPGFSWISFGLGILFTIFVWPWLQTQLRDLKNKL